MAHRIRSFLKRNWRGVLNLITLGALVGLIWAIHTEIFDTLKNIKHVNYWALLLIIPMQTWNYDAYTRLYLTMFNKLGTKVPYWSMFRIALELNFVNHVFPSGGVSGFSYFSLRMKDHGARPGVSTIVQLLRFFMGYFGFFILLGFGIVALAVAGQANGIVVMVATFLATLIVFGTAVLVYIVGDNGRINATSRFLAQIVNWLVGLVRRNKETINLTKLRAGMDEMHRSYLTIQENRDIMKRGVLFGFLTTLTEILTIYVVYIAFGEWVNIGAVIIAYAIANFAGLISVLPGGIGMYEALMTGVLALAGVPPSLSIPVTIMYRVLGISVQILPGYVLYHRAVNRSGRD